MHFRFSALLPVAALAAAVAAAPGALEARSSGTSQCNTGPIQCCDSTYSSSDYQIIELFGFLGIPMGSSSGLVGLGCNPVTVTGTGTGAVCAQQPVCCDGNTFNGVVNVGCSPITING